MNFIDKAKNKTLEACKIHASCIDDVYSLWLQNKLHIVYKSGERYLYKLFTICY